MAIAGATIIKALAINRLFMGFSFLEMRMICKITKVNNASDSQSQIAKLDLLGFCEILDVLLHFTQSAGFSFLKSYQVPSCTDPYQGLNENEF